MTFEEWWKETAGHLSVSTDEMLARAGWEAGVKEGERIAFKKLGFVGRDDDE